MIPDEATVVTFHIVMACIRSKCINDPLSLHPPVSLTSPAPRLKADAEERLSGKHKQKKL